MLATLVSITLVMTQAVMVHGHASILAIYGSNGKIGTGYGVDKYGLFGRHGEGPDAGGDVTVFQEGVAFPNPPCGSSPYLGPIDTESWMSQADGFGVPTANADGTIKFTLFQVNADGGGPAMCEYCSDASLKNSCWKPMEMVVNQPGKDGILFIKFTNHTMVAKFPADAMCTGGIKGDACVMRCRTGANGKTGQRNKFGGCATVSLAAHVRPSYLKKRRHHEPKHT